ncbi:FadR/GntR family transcriptional regulator [Mycobacterium palustre]|uniref:GntR family transcriptional regulator n=1 Tax=Mycobacterium palustre TaxID=153971 RepID=A0A1X1Z3N5_9MYCO|nr:GntR family transcriptional regulator [Mycobacterium palustre]MCV7101187.1 FadR family transcriptional regulator [Mycobacterium palustre]ORW17930.1 GntR family transcriptional regulator [Mycobacterium palustre]
MALHPVIRRSVPDEVFERIATDVLGGATPPGEALPSERRLAEVFGVSRPAVREALQRLSASGLVEVRRGGVATVRDFRRHAGLDLLPLLLFRGGALDASVFRSILEARLRSGPKVAELAAQRHSPWLTELLESTLRTLETEHDPLDWQRLTLRYWDHVVDGAGSIVYRLMYNAFRAAYEPALAALAAAMTAEARCPAAYRKLTLAICAADTAAAHEAAHDVLELANATMIAALEDRGGPR